MNTPPLDGIKVLDLTELAPGPFYTQALLELGADVQKIERPPHGDPSRMVQPGAHAAINVNKPSRQLNLKDPAGVEEIKKLVKAVHIFAEGNRPGVMARLGLTYEVLSAINPRLIYVSITGYGQDGPMSLVPGHDINYLASAGVLALSGGLDRPVSLGVGIPIGGFTGSMYALSSTLAAVIQAERTGQGQHIDVSMTDTMIHWVGSTLAHFQYAGLKDLKSQRDACFETAAYGAFETKDGRWIAIGALEDQFWERLVECLGLDVSDLETNRAADRQKCVKQINERIAAAVASEDNDDVLARLEHFDVPVTQVVVPTDLPVSPHAKARNLFGEVDGLNYVRYPVRLSGM